MPQQLSNQCWGHWRNGRYPSNTTAWHPNGWAHAELILVALAGGRRGGVPADASGLDGVTGPPKYRQIPISPIRTVYEA